MAIYVPVSCMSNIPLLRFNMPHVCVLVRRQTRLAFIQNQMRLLKCFTHGSTATEESNTVPKYVPFLKRSLLTRPFHSSRINHSSCDFGSPCARSEGRQDRNKPICEICSVRPTVTTTVDQSYDRKGIRGYDFTSLCDQCWQESERAYRERRDKEKQILAWHEEKLACMLDKVQHVHSTEQVPIAYAVNKFMAEVRPIHNYRPSPRITDKMMDEARKICSTERITLGKALDKYQSEVRKVGSVQSLHRFRGKFQRQIIHDLSKELQIVKIRNKYLCNRQRVDAMDSKLRFFGPSYEK